LIYLFSNNLVFKGEDPSVINILLSPIFYHNKYENKNLSGYRADFKSYAKGSTKNLFDFYSSTNLSKLQFFVKLLYFILVYLHNKLLRNQLKKTS
jgi:hypothetical protein